jgi:hypothetical protein
VSWCCDVDTPHSGHQIVLRRAVGWIKVGLLAFSLIYRGGDVISSEVASSFVTVRLEGGLYFILDKFTVSYTEVTYNNRPEKR